ncbi:PACE efflux transporter [Rubrivivax gelatinosus]|uniref:PACE efflux transporter n=1 Tax=Rubrivivax gelatinosus TaxID=28068 RepID=UPI001907DA65|nr:PACE efflux transporter [Rubrivivax gelatinosus]
MPATLAPRTRRIVQALLYEAIAIAVVGPVLALAFDEPAGSSFVLALLMSSIALAWNYGFNAVFERWEQRRGIVGRPWRVRALHGLGFEGGLALILVPVMAWWLDTTLWAALLADLALLLFFLVYTVLFTWAFDRVFGLPESARGGAAR